MDTKLQAYIAAAISAVIMIMGVVLSVRGRGKVRLLGPRIFLLGLAFIVVATAVILLFADTVLPAPIVWLVAVIFMFIAGRALIRAIKEQAP